MLPDVTHDNEEVREDKHYQIQGIFMETREEIYCEVLEIIENQN